MNARSILIPAGVLAVALFTGCPKDPPPPTPVAPPSISEFSVSKAAIDPGESVTLSWKVENAVSVTLEQLGHGALLEETPLSGTHEVTLEESAAFALIASSPDGTDSRTLQVAVGRKEPVVLLSAIPNRIAAGESATLAFSAPGASEVKLLDETGAPVPITGGETGTVLVSPRFSTRYTLEADGRTAEVDVTVTPGILSLEAKHLENGDIRVSWRAGGADVLKVEAAGQGEIFPGSSGPVGRGVIAEGSVDVAPPEGVPADAQITYTLTVGEGDGAVQRSVSLRAGGEPAIDRFTAPQYALLGGNVELRWETRGATRAELWLGNTQLFEATDQATVASGIIVVPSPEQVTSYELRVYDAKGNRAVAHASTEPVGEVGEPTFTASTNSISMGGEPVTLTWDVPNARRMRIVATNLHLVHEAEGLAAEKGSVVVYPNPSATGSSANTINYVLTADNTVGSAIAPQTQTVVVDAAAPIQTWPERLPQPTGVYMPEAQFAGTTVPGVAAYVGFPIVEKDAPGDGFVDIRDIGLSAGFAPTDDTNHKIVTLPDPFTGPIFGRRFANYGYVQVALNGWIALQTTDFGSTGPDTNVFGMPSTSLEEGTIAPYFDDLRMTPEADVHVAYVGLGTERRLVVQWTNVELETAPGSRLTFQCQLYTSGKIVFAYQQLKNVEEARPVVGVQDYSRRKALLVPEPPRTGDTYTLFGPSQTPPPYPVYIDPYVARMVMSNGGFLEFNAKPPALTRDLLKITEVNYDPAPGVVDGEWFEITNVSTETINLRGFTIDFGGGVRHLIDRDLIVGPQAQVVLAQVPGAGDGLAVDYDYGPSFKMKDGFGSVAIVTGDQPYTSVSWTHAQHAGKGVSIQFEPELPGFDYATGVTGLVCASRSTYGTNGQVGTPGTGADRCFPYIVSPSAGAFTPIRAFGTRLVPQQGRGDVFTVPLPFEVQVGYSSGATLYVSSNGFVTLEPLTCTVTTAGCHSSNPLTPSQSATAPFGWVAPFWDSFNFQEEPAGIFWAAVDPDQVPDSGDEQVIVSWEDATLHPLNASFVSNLNFQVVLTRHGDIEFRYGDMSSSGSTSSHQNNAKGSSATTGIATPTNEAAIEINVNSATNPGIQPHSGYTLTWAP